VVLFLSCAVCFTIGALFAWNGFWLVMPFSGLEIIALALAFLFWARHAGDYERLWLESGQVVVEVRDGSALAQHRFPLAWSRLLVRQSSRDTQVALCAYGRQLMLGRHLPAQGRLSMARSLHEVCGLAMRLE
jgi:uncharacterized membrane protein